MEKYGPGAPQLFTCPCRTFFPFPKFCRRPYSHVRPFWTSHGEVTFLAQRLRSFSWGERCRRKPSPSWAWTICCVPLLKTWAKTWPKKPGKPGLGGFGIRQTNLGIFGIQSAQSRILVHPISSRYQMAQSRGNWRLHLLFHDVIAEGTGSWGWNEKT